MTYIQMQERALTITSNELRQFARELARQYAIAGREIREEIRRFYSRVLTGIPLENYYNEAIKFDRLQKLQRQVDDLYVQAARQAGIQVRQASRLAMANAYARNAYALNLVTPAINLSFVALPSSMVDIAVLGTPQAWRALDSRVRDRITRTFGGPAPYQPQYGTLSRLLTDRRNGDLRVIRDRLTQGVIQGKGYRETAREITRRVDISRSNALRIVRTETHRNYNAGHYANAQWGRSQGARLRRQIVATLDDRTRPQSAIVDGLQENENGVFIYPGGIEVTFPGNSGVAGFDIHDRERVISVVDGFPPNERRARSYNRETGRFDGPTEVMSYDNFPAWSNRVGLRRNRYGAYL